MVMVVAVGPEQKKMAEVGEEGSDTSASAVGRPIRTTRQAWLWLRPRRSRWPAASGRRSSSPRDGERRRSRVVDQRRRGTGAKGPGRGRYYGTTGLRGLPWDYRGRPWRTTWRERSRSQSYDYSYSVHYWTGVRKWTPRHSTPFPHILCAVQCLSTCTLYESIGRIRSEQRIHCMHTIYTGIVITTNFSLDSTWNIWHPL
jgi:hypothetical protein